MFVWHDNIASQCKHVSGVRLFAIDLLNSLRIIKPFSSVLGSDPMLIRSNETRYANSASCAPHGVETIEA